MTSARPLSRSVIRPALPKELLDSETKFYVNPTGRFVVGGPQGDSGLTGRKIIVDTYGGYAAHGGGCFSGKDPTKVDRSAAYMARYIAKNLVAAGLAKKCQIELAYAIGVAHPVSVLVDSYGTGAVSDERLAELVNRCFDLRPAAIIRFLDLRRPIYRADCGLRPLRPHGHRPALGASGQRGAAEEQPLIIVLVSFPAPGRILRLGAGFLCRRADCCGRRGLPRPLPQVGEGVDLPARGQIVDVQRLVVGQLEGAEEIPAAVGIQPAAGHTAGNPAGERQLQPRGLGQQPLLPRQPLQQRRGVQSHRLQRLRQLCHVPVHMRHPLPPQRFRVCADSITQWLSYNQDSHCGLLFYSAG